MKVGIVGGGVSGLSCLWALRRSPNEIHLYEMSSRLGGHANTSHYVVDGETFYVDTGFIVMHKDTYPNFLAMLDDLDVGIVPTDMSVGVSRDNGRFEWGSKCLSSFFPSLGALLSPSVWLMLLDLIRFNCTAYKVLSSTPALQDPSVSIGDFLREQRYSRRFADDLLIPMVAAPWCTDPDFFKANFPAAKLIPFMHKHGLLSTHRRSLEWHTIDGGSKAYIDAFARSNPPYHNLHLGSNVISVQRTVTGKAVVKLSSGREDVLDHVVLAVHANQALRILGKDASSFEKEVLSSFDVTTNTCFLHCDSAFLPHSPKARSAWNCMMQSTPSNSIPVDAQAMQATRRKAISLTFDMHKLQHIPLSRTGARPLVSMNPISPPSTHTVQGTFTYQHPLFTAASMRAEVGLAALNGSGPLSFAGAWMGFGFHEDGVVAGIHAANSLLPPDARRKIRCAEEDQKKNRQDMEWVFAVITCLRLLDAGLRGIIDRGLCQKVWSTTRVVSVVVLICTFFILIVHL